MPAKNTPATTPALSVSRVLPDGCLAYRNGLVIPAGTSHDSWLKIGTMVTDLARSSLWLIGDWLAYGQEEYKGQPGYERMQNELYAKIAGEVGLAEGTLRNAKYVCSAVNLSRRRDKLTFSHAMEIVGRAKSGQYDFWIDKVQQTGLSQKKLREELRKSNSSFKPEPGDVGVQTFLETARQFVRDFQSECPDWTPQYRAEVAKILGPVVKELG